jgi:hypothetical protein
MLGYQLVFSAEGVARCCLESLHWHLQGSIHNVLDIKIMVMLPQKKWLLSTQVWQHPPFLSLGG